MEKSEIEHGPSHNDNTAIYLRVLRCPRLERLKLRYIFSEFYSSYGVGLHNQMSTTIPTTPPITIPASRLELLVVVVADELDAALATFTSDQNSLTIQKIREISYTCCGCTNNCRRRGPTTVTTAVVTAAGVADVPLHCPR